MTQTLTVKVDVDPDTDRIAVWKDGIGWVEMDRGWFAALLDKRYTEDEMEEALKERDDAIDMADRLSWAIAPMEVIGEHSSGNDPWHNALDEAYALHASAERCHADACVPVRAMLAVVVKELDEAWHVYPPQCDCVDGSGHPPALDMARALLATAEAEAQAPILTPHDAPVFDHPLTNDCIGGGCEDCDRDISDLASVEALLAQAVAEVPDGYGPGEGSVRWASDIAGTPSGSRLLALAIRGAA